MNEDQKLNEKESDALRNLTELCSDKNAVVSFSCGKDSLVVLDLASRIGIKKAVFADTSIEFDETYEYIHVIKDFYDIDVIEPPNDFFNMVENLDLPSKRYRWCCDVLKFGPLSKYAEENEVVAYITGLRREESRRRECYDIVNFNPVMQVPQVNPILDWTTKDIWDYIHKYELPYNPLYENFSRVGCWCCPYRSKEDWRKIEELYPEAFQKLQKVIQNKSNSIKPDYRDLFINFGWSYWVYPLKTLNVGKYEINENIYKIKMNYQSETAKVKQLIKMLDNDYSINGNIIEIVLNEENIKEDIRKIRVIVEKAVNCVQCGSCISLCQKNALYLDTNINVDMNRCDKCSACLIPNGNNGNKKLRLMCVGRNYSRNRKTLILS